MALITSLVISIAPEAPVTTPGYLGRAIYDFFLSYIRSYDAQLANSLHDKDALMPFTCSSLMGGTYIEKDLRQYEPDEPVWFRITGLTQTISFYLGDMANTPPDTITLGNASFKVLGATTNNHEHEWAGKTTYEQLVANHLDPAQKPFYKVGLDFCSPTTFKSQGWAWPVPMPKWVFGSLANKWNLFSPYSEPDLTVQIHQNVVLNRYDLRTKAVPLKAGHPHPGCIGKAYYSLMSTDKKQAKRLNLLTAFAFYAGIGYQTTVGLGQTRPLF